MIRAALLLLVSTFGAAAPAAALEADFVGTFAVRPARGTIDVASGYGGLTVHRWRFVPGTGSDGIDPASEEIVLLTEIRDALVRGQQPTAAQGRAVDDVLGRHREEPPR